VAYVSCLTEEKAEVLRQIQNYVVAEESSDVPELVKDPLLSSALSETLRLQFAGLAPREVTQDTAVTVNGRSYELQKGSVLFVSTSCVHKDPRICKSPDDHRLKRFVQWHKNSDHNANRDEMHFFKNGVPIRHPLIP
jgi:cytochrome P450